MRIRWRKFGIWSLVACLSIGGWSCVTSDAPVSMSSEELMAQSAVVSSYYHRVDYDAGSIFAFWPASRRFVDDPDLDIAAIEALIRKEIAAEMTRKGFVAGGDSGTELFVRYTLATDGTINDKELNKVYQVSAGLPDSGFRNYPKGTVILDIIDGREKTLVWRGSLQVYVDYDISEKDREERIRTSVGRLLRSFN